MKAAQPQVERRGLVIHVDGAPPLLLNAPVVTRPQDWTPAQAAMIWGEAELARRATMRGLAAPL